MGAILIISDTSSGDEVSRFLSERGVRNVVATTAELPSQRTPIVAVMVGVQSPQEVADSARALWGGRNARRVN